MIIKYKDFALDRDSAFISSIFQEEIWQGLFKPKKVMFYFDFKDDFQKGREIRDNYEEIREVWETLINMINGGE